MSPLISQPQSVQTQGVQSIIASNATFTSGGVTFSGVGAATVQTAAAQRIDISVAAQSVQTQGLSAVAASNTTYSSGLAVLTGSNMITVKSSGAGQTVIIDATQSVQVVQSAIAASNTTYTSGLVTITGVGGGVTVSSNTGQRIDISVAAPVAQSVQTQNMVAVSASNTLYSSGTVLFTGSNMITVKSSGAGQTVILDATQSVQIVQSAIAASNTTYTSGLVTITGVGGGVTVSSNTGQRIDISVAAPVAQSVQTQNVVDVTLSGNTAGALALVSSGTLTLAGGNNITLSQAGNAVTISGAAAGGAQTAISSIAASNTTYTSGGVTITGSNMVTVKSTTGQGIVIDATQSVQVVQSAIAATNTTYTSGLVVITGSNMITVKSSGAGQTVILDATQSVQTQGQMSMGVSTGGNTQGNTGVSGTRIVLVGTSNITLSQNTDANGATISISGPNAGAGGGVNIAASNTTFTSGTVVFTASDGPRSGLSVSSGAQTVIISDAGPSLAYYQRGVPGTPSSTNIQHDNASLSVFPLEAQGANRFPGRMTISNIGLMLSYNATATSVSQQLSSTMNVYLYTRTSDSLSLLNSGSMSFGNPAAATANSSNWHGLKLLQISATSAWSAAPALSYGGEYYLGINFRTHITSLASVSWFNIKNNFALNAAPSEVGGATNGWKRWRPGVGLQGTANTGSIALTDLSARSSLSGNWDPFMVLANSTQFYGT